ncbi:hypothetical protein [Actinomadura hibisca]|uniref:hypothetical protein n=1 Tax=Actinomadura hibisca TaxID=68565 RepID=UPI00082A918A|nr:hypothetical protein [Actinomadura hibisca]
MTAVQRSPAASPASPAASEAGPPGTRAPGAPARRAGRPPLRRRLVPRTNVARIRAFTAAIVVALAAALAATWLAIDDARDGVRVIGHDAGPQVVATGDLYFALTDMDAQLANALLVGRTADLGITRAQAVGRYDADRRQAGTALLQAARLADETSEEKTARDLLEALGRYERLAGQALQLDDQSAHAAGPPNAKVVELYRQATDLMKLDLLPKAYNLTLDNGTLVRHTYEDERSAVLTGVIWVIVTGLVLVALLVGLQLSLAVRFRRLLNPALALATVGVLALTVASTLMLTAQAGDLRRAKEDGFDSILALSRARAIGNSANADQTRYLLDPGRSDTYEQVFLTKSQSVMYLRAGNLAAYNQALQGVPSGQGGPKYLGFLGTEAARAQAGPGQRQALGRVLEDWKRFQQDDRQIRELTAAGRRGQAIGVRTGTAARDFAAYDASLVKLIQIHRTAFDRAVDDGDGGSRGWELGLPVVGVAVLALLWVGVRPRLAEYR